MVKIIFQTNALSHQLLLQRSEMLRALGTFDRIMHGDFRAGAREKVHIHFAADDSLQKINPGIMPDFEIDQLKFFFMCYGIYGVAVSQMAVRVKFVGLERDFRVETQNPKKTAKKATEDSNGGFSKNHLRLL